MLSSTRRSLAVYHGSVMGCDACAGISFIELCGNEEMIDYMNAGTIINNKFEML